MSLIGSAKEFFGFGPYNDVEDAYYDDEQYYRESGVVEPEDRGFSGAEHRGGYSDPFVREPRSFAPEIVSTTPRSYNDAKEIGEPFRDGDAVIMDLTELDGADAKRVVDFAAGLCFALRGSMLNLARTTGSRRRVFAIVPDNARITADELGRAARLN